MNLSINSTLNLTQQRVDQLIQYESQLLQRPLSELELQEIHSRVAFERLHAGHEKQHSQMAWILLFVFIFSQFAISFWRKKSPLSYNLATLFGLWWMPCKFLGCVQGFKVPMTSNTPKTVYTWYTWIYNISYIVGFIGYIIILTAFFHIPALITGAKLETEAHIFEAGLILLFYGLYFGTLGRDFVDRLSDRMATNMGFYSKTGFPTRNLTSQMCAICGESTETLGSDKLFVLECKHGFHEFCIRGWTIIGKKDMCPCCKEKVNLNTFKKNPWDTAQFLYLNLLDALRYLLVWNPVVFLIVHFIFNVFGYK